MITIMTSSLGGSCKIDGKRVPTFLLNENGLIDKIKGFWKKGSNVLIISSSPDEFELNDSILYCQKEAFDMSGIKANSFDLCDYRNEKITEKVNMYDVIL